MLFVDFDGFRHATGRTDGGLATDVRLLNVKLQAYVIQAHGLHHATRCRHGLRSGGRGEGGGGREGGWGGGGEGVWGGGGHGGGGGRED